MSQFQNDPRDYALELVENGLTDADYLLTACLKYMSHDDVRDMLHSNELGPKICDNCDEECEESCDLCEECQNEQDIENYLSDHSVGYDTDMMKGDIENGNLSVDDDASEYEHETIVQTSLANGQFAQARSQCLAYGLHYAEQLGEFNS